MRLSGIQSTRLSHHVPRRLPIPSQDADVIPNSLRKTLEAHRSSNRARLIRKVYPRTQAAGLFRPWIPPENRAGYRPPEPSSHTAEHSEPSKKPIGKRRRRQSSAKSLSPGDSIIAIRGADHHIPEQSPWADLLHSSQGTGDASTHLDAEIRALHHYLVPSSREQSRITQLTEEINSLLAYVAPHTPRTIGSHYTGLALAHSDLNFLFPFEDILRPRDSPRGPSATRPQIRDAHTNLLRDVESTLKNTIAFSDQLKWIGKGKTALEACHKPTGLILRFHCGESVPALAEFIKDSSLEYPALKPLYTSARTLLESRGLFGPTQGNISSEALAILVIAFLKSSHGRFPGSYRLGDQFMDLLRFYATDINLTSAGVAVHPLSFFGPDVMRASMDGDDTESAARRGQKSLLGAKRNAALKGNLPADRRLCIQDPTHFMNDLGRGCTRTPELQSALKIAHEQLRQACDVWEGGENRTSILKTALRANFDGLEKVRERVLASAWI
ncbi:uncharacterized protein N7483_007813 [Penicillium malachiteum]|uniref:uncharacterized protein n=1 Tax=Penicillium malachiteum TaxID=1324776 RepID=UPI00254765F1|nr:uncharacterized protein N7483_007813 [Penicillium malachiteum]KAJ5726456.1 hypothetical protein N7483_007813 [Penicillium malachiteum]